MGLTGRSVPRTEDERFLHGRGVFVGDLELNGTLDVVLVRSEIAFGRIVRVDRERAVAAPDIVAVLDGSQIAGRVSDFPATWLEVSPALVEQIPLVLRAQPGAVLATDTVRRYGEPIVAVVGRSRRAAECAASLVRVEYEEWSPVLDADAALDPSAPLLFPEMGTNEQLLFEVVKGDVGAALAASPLRLSERFRIGRQVGSPMENRAVVARWDASANLLTVWATTQHHHLLRDTVSSMLGLSQAEVRVIVPDMGGSFGGCMNPEDVLVPFLARELDAPVRWVESRRESLMNSRHSRDQAHNVDVGYGADGRILAVADHFTMDVGTHNFFGPILGYNTTSHLVGQYDVNAWRIVCRAAVTNKTPVSPVRGAGRLEAAFVMDRILDMIARRLGRDPSEIRHTNLVPADRMPYSVGIPYRDGRPYVYDSGDFPRQLDTALSAFDYPTAKESLQRSAGDHERVGIGLGCYTEASGYGPFEGARVHIDGSGQVVVDPGTAPHGQSHQTTLAQVCADVFSVSLDSVSLRTGDTLLLQYGLGTFASRAAVTAGSAVHLAAQKVLEKVRLVAAAMLDVTPGELRIGDGRVSSKTTPERSASLAEVAQAVVPGRPLATRFGAGLTAEEYFVPPAVTVASGTHVAAVAVDPATGRVRVLRYLVVHDCGRALHPAVVHGQIHGGVAHGIGSTLLEEVIHDERGVPETLDFPAYTLVAAPDVPGIEVIDQDHPSPLNPLGVKGVGEGGAVGAAPAIANAIVDALRPLDLRLAELPITPERLLGLIRAAHQVAHADGAQSTPAARSRR